MRLFDGGRVPNARRVRVFLAEKGISVPLVPVDLGKMEHRSDEFTRRNPFQRVPVLELDDGTVLTESVAICRYFEEIQPEPSLFGTGALERARVEMWNRRIELELYSQGQAAFRHGHPGMANHEVPQIAQWAEVNRARALGTLRLLDDHLSGHRYFAGDAFSIADITALVTIDFLKPARISVPADLTHLARWHAECAGRPSAQA
jgi:glutathione S-transferase